MSVQREAPGANLPDLIDRILDRGCKIVQLFARSAPKVAVVSPVEAGPDVLSGAPAGEMLWEGQQASALQRSCPVCGSFELTELERAHFSSPPSSESTTLAYRCAVGHTFIPGTGPLRRTKEQMRNKAIAAIRNAMLKIRRSNMLLQRSKQLVDAHKAARDKKIDRPR